MLTEQMVSDAIRSELRKRVAKECDAIIRDAQEQIHDTIRKQIAQIALDLMTNYVIERDQKEIVIRVDNSVKL